MRIINDFSIENKVDIFSIPRLVHFPIIIDEVPTSKVPHEIGEKISPRRCCHVDMDDISFVFMQMDTILWTDSYGDITSRDLFHVDITRKIPLFSIDHDEHIGVMMHFVWFFFEKIGDNGSEDDDTEYEEDFFHK